MNKILFSLSTGLVIAGATTATVSAEEVSVNSGDTLWSIAKKNGTSVDQLKDANGLNSNTIYPGQVLQINEATSQDIHMVAYGDTLYRIALNNGISVAELKQWNSLSSNMIYPGQELVLQKAEEPAYVPEVAEKEPKKEVVKEANDDIYTVERGDTLYSIAQANGISVSNLKGWNGLNSDLIHPGQELVLYPVEQPEPVEEVEQPTVQASTVEEAPEPAPEPEPVEEAPAEVEEAPAPAPAPAAAAPEGETITVSATAYTAECYGCSGITYTGVNLNENPNAKVIAVDPDVIPLGTKVYVEGYGEAIAADIGGAIDGYEIDLHVPTKTEAFSWGVRNVEVTILD